MVQVGPGTGWKCANKERSHQGGWLATRLREKFFSRLIRQIKLRWLMLAGFGAASRPKRRIFPQHCTSKDVPQAILCNLQAFQRRQVFFDAGPVYAVFQHPANPRRGRRIFDFE